MLRLSADRGTIPRPTKERFGQLGAEPIGGTPQDLAKHIAAEPTKRKEVVRLSGVKLD